MLLSSSKTSLLATDYLPTYLHMSSPTPLKRSLSRSVIRIIQRTLPLVSSRRRPWTTSAKTRMPIDM